MPRLTQTEYTQRYRAKQKARMSYLEAENANQAEELLVLRSQVGTLQKELARAYRYVDIFERSLEHALGRPFRSDDLIPGSVDQTPGIMSRTLRNDFS